MAGLHAVDRGIRPQETIAIGLFNFVVRKLPHRVVRKIIRMIGNHAARDDCQITHGRDMLRVRQTGRIDEHRVGHAHPASLFVHHRDKRGLTARYGLGQRHRRVVTRLDNHALDELIDRHRLAGLDKHARTTCFPGHLRNVGLLIKRDSLFLERIKGYIRRHDFSQRGGLDFHVGIGRGDNLTAGDIHRDPGFGCDRGNGNSR